MRSGSKFFGESLVSLVSDEAAQLVEFAVILPLLMVIIVGIFDFSQAFNLKQRLGTTAFQGAVLGSTQPTTDLTQATPLTVVAIRDVVDTNLKRADINDCGLSAVSALPTPLTWAATGTCFGSSTLTLTIQRGYTFQATVTGVPAKVNVVSTLVKISYPYQWQFNRVISILVPGATYAGISQLTATSTVPNLD